jgi:hypothetical protein
MLAVMVRSRQDAMTCSRCPLPTARQLGRIQRPVVGPVVVPIQGEDHVQILEDELGPHRIVGGRVVLDEKLRLHVLPRADENAIRRLDVPVGGRVADLLRTVRKVGAFSSRRGGRTVLKADADTLLGVVPKSTPLVGKPDAGRAADGVAEAANRRPGQVIRTYRLAAEDRTRIRGKKIVDGQTVERIAGRFERPGDLHGREDLVEHVVGHEHRDVVADRHHPRDGRDPRASDRAGSGRDVGSTVCTENSAKAAVNPPPRSRRRWDRG